MRKQEMGFTMIELLVTMTIFLIVIAAGAQIFTSLLTQFKQQGSIAETNIEGAFGLEILRQDLEQAGYGLPWNLGGAKYNEAVAESGQTPWVDRDFNDGPPDNPARGSGIDIDAAGACNPPAAVRSGNDATSSLNHSDVLVIKGMNVARHIATNLASGKWTTLSSVSPYVQTWGLANDDLVSTDRVIVISPGATDSNSRTLITGSSSFPSTASGYPFSTLTYSGVTSTPFIPGDPRDTRVVYGVDSTTDLRMPFNRADYYLKNHAMDSNVVMPTKCAPGTGILFKGVLNQSNGLHTELPLLDCVLDLQVDFVLDTDGNGNINWSPPSSLSDNTFPSSPANDISSLTARQIRAQLKEVRVYVVAQEGQRDLKYDFSMGGTRTSISYTEVVGGNSRALTFPVSSRVGDPEYKYYRWRLYTIVVKPKNLQ